MSSHSPVDPAEMGVIEIQLGDVPVTVESGNEIIPSTEIPGGSINCYSEANLAHRDENEDSIGIHIIKGGVVAVLADGAGGHGGGKEASLDAVTQIQSRLGNISFDSPEFVTEVKEIILSADQVVIDDDVAGVTTLAMALVNNGKAHIFHAGDSVVHLLRNGNLQQLTEEHTAAAKLAKENGVSPDYYAGVRHVLLHALGNSKEPLTADNIGYNTIDLLPGDKLLIECDGLQDIPSQIKASILAKGGENVAELLTKEALKWRSTDNCSALVINYGSEPKPQNYIFTEPVDKDATLADIPIPEHLRNKESTGEGLTPTELMKELFMQHKGTTSKPERLKSTRSSAFAKAQEAIAIRFIADESGKDTSGDCLFVARRTSSGNINLLAQNSAGPMELIRSMTPDESDDLYYGRHPDNDILIEDSEYSRAHGYINVRVTGNNLIQTNVHQNNIVTNNKSVEITSFN